MGNKRGRLCLLYQVDLEEDKLRYGAKLISGEVDSEESFLESVSKILEAFKTDRIEVALKSFRLPDNQDKRISGICLKSFPRTRLTSRLIEMLNMCMGGQSGVELIHLPFAGTILNQPNIFIQAYFIYSDEVNKFLKESMPKHETKR